MKKLLALVAIAGTVSFLACGPSAEELEKIKKQREDSIRVADSIASAAELAKQQREMDSLKQIEDAKMQMMKDSLMKDSIEKAGKKGKK